MDSSNEPVIQQEASKNQRQDTEALQALIEEFERNQQALSVVIQEFNLPPTKIKRQYKCSSCDHVTVNPRLHLRHRQATHGHKVRIVECPLCVYACQYRQKLNRHLRLVHQRPANNNGQGSNNDRASLSQYDSDDEPLDLSMSQEVKLSLKQSTAPPTY